MPDSALVTISHLMWRPPLGNPLVAKIAVILELAFVEVLEHALPVFGRLFHTFIELILCRVLHFLPLVLNGLRMARAKNPPTLRGLAGGRNLLGVNNTGESQQQGQQTKDFFHTERTKQ